MNRWSSIFAGQLLQEPKRGCLQNKIQEQFDVHCPPKHLLVICAQAISFPAMLKHSPIAHTCEAFIRPPSSPGTQRTCTPAWYVQCVNVGVGCVGEDPEMQSFKMSG